jgi:hypothetical protein
VVTRLWALEKRGLRVEHVSEIYIRDGVGIDVRQVDDGVGVVVLLQPVPEDRAGVVCVGFGGFEVAILYHPADGYITRSERFQGQQSMVDTAKLRRAHHKGRIAGLGN